MAKVISARKLTALKKEWQAKLRLMDWRIKIRFTDLKELEDWTGIPDAIGACRHHAETKSAEIIVLDPKYFGDDATDRTADVENTVVHELLHCHFAPLRTDEPANRLIVEQIIELVSEVVLAEKRHK